MCAVNTQLFRYKTQGATSTILSWDRMYFDWCRWLLHWSRLLERDSCARPNTYTIRCWVNGHCRASACPHFWQKKSLAQGQTLNQLPWVKSPAPCKHTALIFRSKLRKYPRMFTQHLPVPLIFLSCTRIGETWEWRAKLELTCCGSSHEHPKDCRFGWYVDAEDPCLACASSSCPTRRQNGTITGQTKV